MGVLIRGGPVARLLFIFVIVSVYAGKKLEARVRIELTVEVLQTSALPLGDRAG
jgi:hypothetical protein